MSDTTTLSHRKQAYHDWLTGSTQGCFDAGYDAALTLAADLPRC